MRFVSLLILLLALCGNGNLVEANEGRKEWIVLDDIQVLNLSSTSVGYVAPGEVFEVKASFRVRTEGDYSSVFIHVQTGADGVKVDERGDYITIDQHSGVGEYRGFFQADSSEHQLDIEILASHADGPLEFVARVPFFVTRKVDELARDQIVVLADNYLELLNQGKFSVSRTAAVWERHSGESRRIPFKHVILGARDVQVKVSGNQIVEMNIHRQMTLDTIRVAIMTGQFGALDHQELALRSASALILSTDRLDQDHLIPANAPIVLKGALEGLEVWVGEQLLTRQNSRFYLLPQAEEGQIKVESFRRGTGSGFYPEYRGVFEINPRGSRFMVINEVEMDHYLYQVLPSEMPTSWPMEALKAQAVAARTYAVRSALNSRYGDLGYHVDDSVQSQVYNNQPEAETTNTAIRETSGVIMRSAHDGEIVSAYFHSTSSGMTAAAHQVWNAENGQFPGKEIAYLQARSVTTPPDTRDMTEHINAWDFFTDVSIRGFDLGSPWFRWDVHFSYDQLESAVTQGLRARYKVQPDYILTKVGDEFQSQPVPESGVGRILDLQVGSRGDGGNVMVMDVVGSERTIRVIKELNIRYVINPSEVTIYRQGPSVDNYPLLPSTFMVWEITPNSAGEIEAVTFYGGGNGHGAGMSQYGAKGMAEAGYAYQQILRSFYSEIEFVDITTPYR